jgi:putative transposase
MGHSYSDMLSHIVFSTKHREQIITDDLKPKLYSYMAGIIEELEGKAIIINGIPDHVHILTTISPKISVSEFIGKVKAN